MDRAAGVRVDRIGSPEKSAAMLALGLALFACDSKPAPKLEDSETSLRGAMQQAARSELPPLSAAKQAETRAKLARVPGFRIFDVKAVAGPTSLELRDGKILRLAFLKAPKDPDKIAAAKRRLQQIFIETRAVVYTTDKQHLAQNDREIVAQANAALDGMILVDAAGALVQEGLLEAKPEGEKEIPITYRAAP